MARNSFLVEVTFGALKPYQKADIKVFPDYFLFFKKA